MPQATTRLPSQSPRVGEPFAFRRRWPSSSVSCCFWEEPKKGILGRIPSSLFPSVSLRNVYIWKAKPFPSFSSCTIPLVQPQPLVLSSLTRLASPMVSLILHTHRSSFKLTFGLRQTGRRHQAVRPLQYFFFL